MLPWLETMTHAQNNCKKKIASFVTRLFRNSRLERESGLLIENYFMLIELAQTHGSNYFPFEDENDSRFYNKLKFHLRKI